MLVVASLLISSAFAIFHYYRFNAINKHINDSENDNIKYTDSQPGVSVIVYASNDADYLTQYIPRFMSQRYPNFEVIVVNDGSTDSTKDVLSNMELLYRNLYQTFIPTSTRSLSKKKLALMLGIKAAKYDYIITTNANCSPTCDDWLASIMRNFTDNTDVVIGYSHINPKKDTSFGHRYRAFDYVISSVQYLSYAIRGKAYRGISDNLAYRKRSFFDNKGFSQSLNLHFGDDDLFINEITNSSNTRVELSKPSQLIAHYSNNAAAFNVMKMRYDFTSKLLPRKPFVYSGLASTLLLSNIVIAITLIVLFSINAFCLIITLLLMIIALLPYIIIFSKESKILSCPTLLFSLPFLLFLRPFVNLFYRAKGYYSKKLNYTWQRRRR